MVQRAGAYQLDIGAYALCGVGGQIAYGYGVLERAGTFVAEPQQQRIVDIGEFDKRDD